MARHVPGGIGCLVFGKSCMFGGKMADKVPRVEFFPDILGGGARFVEVVHPAAHPVNRGVDGMSGAVRGDSGEIFFLKVLNSEQRLWADVENAADLARKAGEARLAPRLLAVDKDSGAFLFEYAGDDWRPAFVLDAREEEVRERIIKAARAIHGLEPLSHDMTVARRITEMRGLMENGVRHAVTGKKRMPGLPEGYEGMAENVDAILQAFVAAGSETAPCHVENSLSNFLLGPDGAVLVVDFDRAANSDPLSDLGSLCNEFCRTDDDLSQAVEIYAGQVSKDVLARVKLHMILSAFCWGLWGKISQAMTGRNDIEFFKYGENQFIRCAWLLSHWDAWQLIREI